MSLRNYHYSLRNSPEERSYHLLRGGSLKSRMITSFFKNARQLFLAGKKTELDETGGRILLGDNTGCGAVMSCPITLQGVGVWISADDRMDIQIRLAQNLTGTRISETSLLLRKSGSACKATKYFENVTKCFVLTVTDQYPFRRLVNTRNFLSKHLEIKICSQE
jgi:hypothetical protein